MNQSLIGFGLFCGEATQLSEKTRSDTNGDEVLGVSGFWPSDTPCAAELFLCGFRDIGEIDFAIRHRPRVLCVTRDAR